MADKYGEEIVMLPIPEFDENKRPVLDENGIQKKTDCVFTDKKAALVYIKNKCPPIRSCPPEKRLWYARNPTGLTRDFYLELVEENRTFLRCHSGRGRGD